ncbi:hypothetical protein H1I77_11815 [Macrococcus bohemicus]|nr:hypothetical protein [Macrococcus bohemicus]
MTHQIEKLMTELVETYYIADVMITEKVFIFSRAIEYIDVNHYGFIDYGNIILK